MNKAKNEKRSGSLLQEVKDWKSGKLRLKTSILNDDGTRAQWEESRPEAREREERLGQFKSIRADLGFTQVQMAAALHVALKTLQGWEIGKPIPDMALAMADLLHEIPAVRKRLLTVA